MATARTNRATPSPILTLKTADFESTSHRICQ